jgi:hypothetical protein
VKGDSLVLADAQVDFDRSCTVEGDRSEPTGAQTDSGQFCTVKVSRAIERSGDAVLWKRSESESESLGAFAATAFAVGAFAGFAPYAVIVPASTLMRAGHYC